MTAADTLVTIATYNEMENLPLLVEAVFAVAPDVHILVVDDNSPDGTGRWCDEYAAKDSRLRCIHREGKLGLGTATILALQTGIQQGYRYILNMDADFSHPPEKIPELIAAMAPCESPPADVAIGSRYVPGGTVAGWPRTRRWMSAAVNGYARLLLRLPVRDCSGAFRCYRASRLQKLDFATIQSRGYSFQEEVLYRLKRAGTVFREVPITFTDRRRGKSKINTREALEALLIIARLGLFG